MAEEKWNPWKATTVGMAVVFATALITGLVVANWSGREETKGTVAPGAGSQQVAKPSPADIEACNLYAKQAAGDNRQPPDNRRGAVDHQGRRVGERVVKRGRDG